MSRKSIRTPLAASAIACIAAFVSGNAAAATGDHYTMLNQCIGYYNQSQYEQALPCFTKVAKTGNDQAQTYLGIMYQHGFGTQTDLATAAKWYKLAARQGDAWARSNLAAMSNPELATGKDYAEYREALDTGLSQNEPEAQMAMGIMHYYGLGGVPQDYGKARTLFEKAAKGGNTDAASYLGRMYYYAIGTEQNSMMARQYLQQAAQGGNIQAKKLLKTMK